MVRITKVYTKKGDQGTTTLLSSKRISKNLPIINALGVLDEVNAFLGWVIVAIDCKQFNDLKSRLLRIQNELFDISANLCLEEEGKHAKYEKSVKSLEKEIDEMNSKLPALDSFILPGGNELSARLHIARTVCRRAERAVVTFAQTTQKNQEIPYLNRLSDWLFVAARFVTASMNVAEPLWIPDVDKKN